MGTQTRSQTSAAHKACSTNKDDFIEYIADIKKLKQTLLALIAKKEKRNRLHPELEKKEQKTEYSTVQSIFKEGDSQAIFERAVAKLTASHYEILGTEQIVQSILEDGDSSLSQSNPRIATNAVYEENQL